MYPAHKFDGPEYDVENIDEPTLIISISSTDDKLPLIMNEADNENIRHIEYLQFDDIDTAESLHGLKPMSDEDAGCIVDALIQYVDEVSQIIVHCDAGYSRSPAVAAALAKALGESDEEFSGMTTVSTIMCTPRSLNNCQSGKSKILK